MAVIKFINREDSTGDREINQLAHRIDYITDGSRTIPGLIGGVGVDASNALFRMSVVKGIYHKTDGRQYVEFVASFKDKVPLGTAFELARDLALHYSDFQVLYAVHYNVLHVHIHFIVNTVSVVDGHKFSQGKKEMQSLKNYFRLLCDKRCIDLENTPDRNDNYNGHNRSRNRMSYDDKISAYRLERNIPQPTAFKINPLPDKTMQPASFTVKPDSDKMKQPVPFTVKSEGSEIIQPILVDERVVSPIIFEND